MVKLFRIEGKNNLTGFEGGKPARISFFSQSLYVWTLLKLVFSAYLTARAKFSRLFQRLRVSLTRLRLPLATFFHRFAVRCEISSNKLVSKSIQTSINTLLFLSTLFVCFALTSCNSNGTEAQAPAEKSHAPSKRALFADANRNGIPDGAEIRSYEDRENFRDWFTAIAEYQFYKPSEAWNPKQRDCSGLVRFAWREALRKHDRLWFQKMGAEYESVAPDVASYDLENGILKERLFRTKDGLFNKSDLTDGTFQEFADAATLMKYNAVFLGKDRSQLKPGDLVFYFQPFVQKYPYHVMIFLGEARTNNEGARDWVVYHTGTSSEDKGIVKKVRLDTLDQHPDPRWRPVVNNKNFLGYYRLKILEDKEN